MSKKRPSTNQSTDKMRAISLEDAPWEIKDDGNVQVNSVKLARVWARQADALLSLGGGFQTVVESINSLLEDNESIREVNLKTRQDYQRTRNLVLVCTLVILLIFASLWFEITSGGGTCG